MSARLVLLLAALGATACGSKVDPCASVDGTCVVLALHSATVTAADEVDVTLSGVATGTRVATASAAVKLPISIGLRFAAGESGPFHVDLRLLEAGHLVGSGAVDSTLVSGQHPTLDVPVEAAADLDLGVDQAMQPAVDAGEDLTEVDLTTDLAHDLSVAGPLLGDPVVEGSVDTHSPGLADASNYVASQSGTVAHLSAYLSAGDVNTYVIGLYDDLGGHPHTLLTSGNAVAPMVNAWNTISVSPVTVTAGSIYWIAVVGALGSGTSFSFPYGVVSGPTTEHSTQSNLSALPATWSTGATFPNTRCSFYASP